MGHPDVEDAKPTGTAKDDLRLADLYPPPMDTPTGYPPVIVGQKRRIAPRLTHDHAEHRFQAPFRTLTGEMSTPPLAPGRHLTAFDPQSRLGGRGGRATPRRRAGRRRGGERASPAGTVFYSSRS